MSEETSTPQGGGAAPAADNTEVTTTTTAKPAPKSDAEAEAREQEGAPQDEEAKKKADAEKAAKEEQEKSERRKNRTREYINKINRENAELRQRLAEREQAAPQPKADYRQQSDGEPTLEEHNFDPVAFQRAHSRWAVEQALKAEREKSTQAETIQQRQQVASAYYERVADFTDEHPDFQEVAGSIAYPLSEEIQLAIMAHDKGAEIAYHLGNNDDDAFALASIQPHLAAAAVDRIASRLTAAQEAPNTAAPAAPQNPKPVSQAPAPAPTVSGRSPVETPPEKLTDDQWYQRDREKRRKR